MTVHRFRIFHSTAGASAFQDWFGQFTLNVNAALKGELTREQTTLREPIDDAANYYAGDFAFAWEEGKANLYQNFDAYLASYCDWHRIAYHGCTHDETDAQPCAWEEVRESGTVPAHIPSLL